jgi:hypothetical protein
MAPSVLATARAAAASACRIGHAAGVNGRSGGTAAHALVEVLQSRLQLDLAGPAGQRVPRHTGAVRLDHVRGLAGTRGVRPRQERQDDEDARRSAQAAP